MTGQPGDIPHYINDYTFSVGPAGFKMPNFQTPPLIYEGEKCVWRQQDW